MASEQPAPPATSGQTVPGSIAVLGAGSMGTAMAIHLQRCGLDVTLWARRDDVASAIRESGENERLLPGQHVSNDICVTSDPAIAAAADVLLVAVPSKYLRNQLREIASHFGGQTPVISVIKGIEVDTFARPSEIIRDELGERPIACLSGPSHAEEIARELPTSLVAASPDVDWAGQVQRLATTDRFRVYTSPDLVGVEIAGALKNVVGLAAGIGDGIQYGDNAKAALLTRAILEMQRFGVAFGADPWTFAGLAGIGDLITTCTSQHGRNRAVGKRIGEGQTLSEVLASMNGQVSEGVPTTQAVFAMLADRAGDDAIELPIVSEVHAVLFDDKCPRAACDSLMTRPPKPE